MEFLPYPVTQIGCSSADQKILQTRQQLDEVMGVMRSNIEKISERSERLDKLAARAEVLDMSACSYRKLATEVKASVAGRNLPKMVLAACVVVCVLTGTAFCLV